MKKKDVSLVLPHSTATQANDLVQADVNRVVFGRNQPYSYSFTAQLGHPMGASGILRLAVAALAVKNQIIPPTYGTSSIDPECAVRLAPRPLKETVKAALVSAIAFGGNNVAMVIGQA